MMSLTLDEYLAKIKVKNNKRKYYKISILQNDDKENFNKKILDKLVVEV